MALSLVSFVLSQELDYFSSAGAHCYLCVMTGCMPPMQISRMISYSCVSELFRLFNPCGTPDKMSRKERVGRLGSSQNKILVEQEPLAGASICIVRLREPFPAAVSFNF